MTQTPEQIADGPLYYIVDVREDWRGRPYISFWRPKNGGYAYPLPWSGRYTKEQIDGAADYYYTYRYPSTRTLSRFPVECSIVERLGVQPDRGVIDGDIGPVVLNTFRARALLRRRRYNPLAVRDMILSRQEGGR